MRTRWTAAGLHEEGAISGTLFIDPKPLSRRTISRLALSVLDYAHLQSLLLLRVSHVECAVLARHLPLPFVRIDGTVGLYALLGLRAGRTILHAAARPEFAALPLLLRAFPLGLGGRDEAGRARLVAEAAPPRHHAIAAFAPDGSLSAPFLDKADALWLYASGEARDAAMLMALDAAGAFAAWRLRLIFDDGRAPIGDLLTLSAGFTDGSVYCDLVARFGPALALLVEHHLLSKARIDRLADLDGEIGHA